MQQPISLSVVLKVKHLQTFHFQIPLQVVHNWHDLGNANFHCWDLSADAENPVPFSSCPGQIALCAFQMCKIPTRGTFDNKSKLQFLSGARHTKRNFGALLQESTWNGWWNHLMRSRRTKHLMCHTKWILPQSFGPGQCWNKQDSKTTFFQRPTLLGSGTSKTFSYSFFRVRSFCQAEWSLDLQLSFAFVIV